MVGVYFGMKQAVSGARSVPAGQAASRPAQGLAGIMRFILQITSKISTCAP